MRVELSTDLDALRRVATRIGRRYMGAERAKEFGARKAAAGELLVRRRPTRVFAEADGRLGRGGRTRRLAGLFVRQCARSEHGRRAGASQVDSRQCALRPSRREPRAASRSRRWQLDTNCEDT